jgi:hypothetical protein
MLQADFHELVIMPMANVGTSEDFLMNSIRGADVRTFEWEQY